MRCSHRPICGDATEVSGRSIGGKYGQLGLFNHKSNAERPLTIRLAPASCGLLIWRPLADHPQLVATNRHLTQGAIDLQRVAWSSARLELSGSSQVVGRDDYRVLFTVPAGWEVASAGVTVDRGVGVLTLRSEANRTMDWKVKFRRRSHKLKSSRAAMAHRN